MRYLCSLSFALLFSALFLLPVQAATTEPTVRLQSLLLLGLTDNLGLRAARLSVPSSRDLIAVEEAGFDVELFASTDYLRSRAAYASNLSPETSIDLAQAAGSVGLRKHFASGLDASLSLTSTRSDDDLPSEALNPRNQTGLSLALTQPLLRNGGRASNLLSLNLAKGESRQAEYFFLQQAQNLVLGIEIGYYDLLLARNTEVLRQDSWQLAKELREGNQRKLDAGVIPISELHESETAVAGRQLEYVVAQQQREVQAHRLSALLQSSLPQALTDPPADSIVSAELVLPQNAYALNVDDALQSAEQSRPDLLIAAIDIENSELRVAVAQSRIKPQLDLDLQLSANGLSGSERSASTSPYRGDWSDSLSSMTAADGYQWGAGLRFSYPLGNRGLKAGARLADSQRQQAQLSLRDLLIRVDAELRERLTQVERLGQLVEIATRFQDLASLSYTQETRRLDEGLSDSFRVLSFQAKMIAARISRITALVEFNKSLASLSYAMGTNLLRHGIVANLSAKEIRFEEY